MAKRKPPVRKAHRGDRQKLGGRPVKPLVLLAVEGATEREYVKALIANRYGNRIAVRFAPTGDHSSLDNLVASIGREMKEYGAQVKGAWIVCDTDKNACHRVKLEKWLAGSKRHHAVISCPCVEYWFLLHLCESPSSVAAKNAKRELGKCWQWGEYRKGGQVPSELIEATDEAVRRAHQRRKSLGDDADAWNSLQWTDMPELIAWLDELDPGETRH